MYYKADKMNDSVLMWLFGTLGTGIAVLFGLNTKKVDKSEYHKHCDSQNKKNEQFWGAIKESNDLNKKVEIALGKVETILEERERRR